MQKWEYLQLLRARPFADYEGVDYFVPGEWKTTVNGQLVEMDDYLKELGEQGWELVSVVAESDLCGGIRETGGKIKTQSIGKMVVDIPMESADIAGFTTREKWIFKRPKE